MWRECPYLTAAFQGACYCSYYSCTQKIRKRGKQHRLTTNTPLPYPQRRGKCNYNKPSCWKNAKCLDWVQSFCKLCNNKVIAWTKNSVRSRNTHLFLKHSYSVLSGSCVLFVIHSALNTRRGVKSMCRNKDILHPRAPIPRCRPLGTFQPIPGSYQRNLPITAAGWVPQQMNLTAAVNVRSGKREAMHSAAAGSSHVHDTLHHLIF